MSKKGVIYHSYFKSTGSDELIISDSAFNEIGTVIHEKQIADPVDNC